MVKQMPTTLKSDQGASFDLLLEPIQRRSPLYPIKAIKLFQAHGMSMKAAKVAIESPMAAMPRALRLHGVRDPQAILRDLAEWGFPARLLAKPSTPEQMAQWAADDPDMAEALKGDFVAIEPTLVQSIRRRLNLSQAQFAARYGIPVSCIRAWEIRRAKPDASTMALLEMIDAEPAALARAHAKAEARKAKAMVPAE